MKIEILLLDYKELNEKCNGMTCYEAPQYIKDHIAKGRMTQGIVIIDGTPIKFSFSSLGMDGDIFTTNGEYKEMIKYLIPLYLYTKS